MLKAQSDSLFMSAREVDHREILIKKGFSMKQIEQIQILNDKYNIRKLTPVHLLQHSRSYSGVGETETKTEIKPLSTENVYQLIGGNKSDNSIATTNLEFLQTIRRVSTPTSFCDTNSDVATDDESGPSVSRAPTKRNTHSTDHTVPLTMKIPIAYRDAKTNSGFQSKLASNRTPTSVTHFNSFSSSSPCSGGLKTSSLSKRNPFLKKKEKSTSSMVSVAAPLSPGINKIEVWDDDDFIF